MKIFAKAINFFVYSNLLIATVTAAYTAKTALLLYGNNGNLHVNLIAFSATLLFYCFHRINKKKFLALDENKEARNNWMNTHKSIYYILIAISFLLLSSQVFYMPFRACVVFIPVGLLGIGYTFPVIPTQKKRKRLRDIYWFKTLWIALALAWITTFLPVIFMESLSSSFKPQVLFIFSRSFLFIFVLCIPFDIRDMNFDKLNNVNTLPIRVGIKSSIYIAIILLLVFICIAYIQLLYFKLAIGPAFALLLSAMITLSLLPFAQAKRPPLFFPIVYDGAMLLQWGLIFIFIHYPYLN